MSEARVSTSKFKAHCARVIERVSNGEGPIVITRHGRPLARLVAVEVAEPGSLFGFAKGAVTVHGDIVGPLDEAWEADE